MSSLVSLSSSPSFLSFLHHVNCRAPLKHLAAFNIASKAADFKLNPTTWSITKQTWCARSFTRGFNLYLQGLLYVGPGCAAGVTALIKQVGGLFMCEQQLEQTSPTCKFDRSDLQQRLFQRAQGEGFFNTLANPVFQPCLFAPRVEKKLERRSSRGEATAHVRP